MPVRPLAFLAVLALASCTSVGEREEADRIARNVALVDSARAEFARFTGPGNRVPPGDGLVYEFRPCAHYTFDSVRGTLVRRGRDGGPDTVRAALPPGAFESIVAEADRIGLWSYPLAFGDSLTVDAAQAAVNGRSEIEPNGEHRVDLRDGARSASVWWSNRVTGPLTPEAERLRALARQIEEEIGAYEAAERFPPLGYVCL